MASGNESYNPSSYPPEDPRDAVRNPYIAREVLRCPPVGPEHILRTVRADGFSSELGTLLPRGTNYYDFNEAIPAGCVGLLLPNDFTASYGEALEGTRTTTMLGITVQDHLKVPRSHFTAGGAYDHNQLTQHIVLMTKPAWQAMARKTLAVL